MTRIDCYYCGASCEPGVSEPVNACVQCWLAVKSQGPLLAQDWGLGVRNNPGYWEPDAWLIH